MNEIEPRRELQGAVDALSDERARTLLGWLRTMYREDEPPEREFPGELPPPRGESVGPLGDMLGIVAEQQTPGRARMRLTVDPAWNNPHGVLHGGVIYTLIDYSMGGSVMPGLPEGEYCATIQVQVNYLSSVREGTLWVDTTVIKQGRNIAFTESKVWDNGARLVATASGSMFIFRQNEQE
jgi:acyl-CoA thioesterase